MLSVYIFIKLTIIKLNPTTYHAQVYSELTTNLTIAKDCYIIFGHVHSCQKSNYEAKSERTIDNNRKDTHIFLNSFS